MNEKWREYQDMTTDMFDTLSDEIEITASQMADNLEENQRIVSEWADNIAILAERGVDDGLLDKLREAGPESAGHVNALVNASDEELERDRKSTRLNSSHVAISYAVFCLNKKSLKPQK